MELISTASGNEDAVALISTASLGASLNGFISRWDSQQKPGLAPVKMSNSLQANQTTQERSVESEILGGPGVEDETIDMDFSLPDLDCTDPTFLYFDPFPSTNYEIPSFLSPDVPVGAIDQTMTTDNDLFQRSRELNALHSKLQKRIDELEETCRRLENEYGQTTPNEKVC